MQAEHDPDPKNRIMLWSLFSLSGSAGTSNFSPWAALVHTLSL
jgi:hypothetical protein